MKVTGGARPPEERSWTERRADEGVKANTRLTAPDAAVLLVPLAAEGVTILSVRQLISPDVFIGMLLIPPVLVKIGSTGYRFVRYYAGAPAYRREVRGADGWQWLIAVRVVADALLGLAALGRVGPGWHRSTLDTSS